MLRRPLIFRYNDLVLPGYSTSRRAASVKKIPAGPIIR
ncbi:MAG: hypothetical protein JRI59_00290 [Deltaproteobacteria bacterium]|nr:hypothetical protein [Deltaproteobacteria bacterium]